MATGCADGGRSVDMLDTGGGTDAATDGSGDTGGLDDTGTVDTGGMPDLGMPDTGGRDTGGEFDCREGEACSADDNGCTMDICRGGRCVVGERLDCDDGVECTDDSCTSTGADSHVCENTLSATSCQIDGECLEMGARNPAVQCEVCEPSSSGTMWSVATSGTCDDGNSCTTADMCTAEGCVGTGGMGDPFEANDTRASASRLMNVSDGDDYPKGMVSGSIYPEGDVDWFVYNDSDDFPSLIYPRASLRMPLGTNLDLCAFVECETSLESVDCEDGTRVVEGGMTGCCSRNSGSTAENVRINHDCSSSDDSADIFVRVVQVSGTPDCDDEYTLSYGDD